jgi:protoheme IX farnesyltransferase
MESCNAPPRFVQRMAAFFELCKPRVNSLIVFTAMIGMWLAAPDMARPGRFLLASLGIALVAGGAAAINCLVERTSDALMTRTRARATARGDISTIETLTLATLMGGVGLWLLHAWVNDLTMWMTLATFVGYAIIYTVVLKPMTPMNIVIGGAAGAMPPVLGWAAMTGQVTPQSLALFLIIFLWTPPHFWSLACYRREEFARAGLPMLPVIRGVAHTCRHSLFYVIALTGASFLPVALGMAGTAYGIVVAALDVLFIVQSYQLCRNYSDASARWMFRYSITYLTVLFAVLLADHLLLTT